MKNNTAIILILLSIGLFFTFTTTQYQEVKRAHLLASEYRSVLGSVSAIIGLRDNLLSDYETLPRAEVTRINKVLPDNIDTVRLALDLDSIASRYGISIKNVQTDTEVNADANLIVLPEFSSPYDKVTVSFSFISNYANFIRLLADLERNLRIMDIKSISFRASDSNLYDYQISVETYWLK
jgi:hypothetical protein